MAEKTQMMSNKIGIVMLVIASAAQLGLSTPIYDYASVLCAEDEALIGQKAQELLNARGWTAAVVTYARPIPQVGGNAEPWAAAQTNTVVFYMPVNTSGGVPRLGVSPDLEAVLPAPIRAWIAQEEMAAPHHALDICAAVVAGIEALLLDRVQLSSVTFEEGYAIKDASVPQWGYTGAEGEEVLSAHPVCYKRQDEMKLRPVFSYLGPPPVGDIKIRARANGEDYIVAGSLSAGSTIQPSGALIAIGTGGAVDYRPDFQVDWALSFDGGASWQVMGATVNKVFVTWGEPLLGDAETSFYEPFFYYGCKQAQGYSGGSTEELIDQLWAVFAGRRLDIGHFHPDRAPKEITYYGKPFPEYYSRNIVLVDEVLEYDGECRAFAEMLIVSLLHQGVGAERITWSPENLAEEFFVKHWSFPSEESFHEGIYSYVNQVSVKQVAGEEPSLPMADVSASGDENDTDILADITTGLLWVADIRREGHVYEWIGAADVVDLPSGLPGQNIQNPYSDFGVHYLVFASGNVYDPSYGNWYASIDDWADSSVEAAFFFTEQPVGSGNYYYYIRKYTP